VKFTCVSKTTTRISVVLYALRQQLIYTVSQKNNIDVAHYISDIDEGILIIFSRYVTKKISN